MNESGVTKLDQMTTREIAEAVDARKYWRGFHHRLLCIARKGAFSWFLFQYLFIVRLNPFWIIVITICLLIVEIRTNRFTTKTYSTCKIVDLLMKRNTFGQTRNDAQKKLAPGFFLCLLGVIFSGSGVPLYWYHVCFVFGIVWMLIGMKSIDNITTNKNVFYFNYIEAKDGLSYMEVRYRYGPFLHHPFPFVFIVYFGLAIAMAFPLLVCIAGGLETLQGPQHMAIMTMIVFPGIGCLAHETVRFHLVQRELNLLAEIERPNGRNRGGA